MDAERSSLAERRSHVLCAQALFIESVSAFVHRGAKRIEHVVLAVARREPHVAE